MRGTPVGFGVLGLGVQGLGLRPLQDFFADLGSVIILGKEGLAVAEDHVRHHAARPVGGLQVWGLVFWIRGVRGSDMLLGR